jgi:hypothetical protein
LGGKLRQSFGDEVVPVLKFGVSQPVEHLCGAGTGPEMPTRGEIGRRNVNHGRVLFWNASLAEMTPTG